MSNLVNAADIMPPDTEKEFQSRILKIAGIYGFKFQYHPFYSQRSTGGWPDLTLLNPDAGVGVMAELKREGGKLTKAQREWLLALTECGIDAVLWTPAIEDAIVAWLYSPIGNAPSVDYWSETG